MSSRLVLVAAVLLAVATALFSFTVPSFAVQGDACEMAEAFGGKSLYYNVLCFFDWLITWT